jgi:hypothetical protein
MLEPKQRLLVERYSIHGARRRISVPGHRPRGRNLNIGDHDSPHHQVARQGVFHAANRASSSLYPLSGRYRSTF